MRPQVAVVVLNWNGREDTLECLRSLSEVGYEPYEVVVVDNGSSDGSVEAIRRAFPRAHLLLNGRNLGYAGGNNVGLRYALKSGADYALLLNNDTVVNRALLGALVAAAEGDPRIGVVGPKILYHDRPEVLWYAGAREQPLRRIPATVGLDQVDRGQHDRTGETDFVYGTAMLIRRRVLEEVGLLDERYFAYQEDADYSLRAREAGYRCLYEPRAVVWHKVSASTRGASETQDYLRGRSRILFYVKHVRRALLPVVLAWEVYRLTRVWVERLGDGQARNASAYTRGLWHGVQEFMLGRRTGPALAGMGDGDRSGAG